MVDIVDCFAVKINQSRNTWTPNKEHSIFIFNLN